MAHSGVGFAAAPECGTQRAVSTVAVLQALSETRSVVIMLMSATGRKGRGGHRTQGQEALALTGKMPVPRHCPNP